MNRQKEILGAMILDPTLADHPDLKPSLFSSGFERSVFEAIQEFRQNGSTVDLPELARCVKLRQIDGVASQLSGLLDGQPKIKDVFYIMNDGFLGIRVKAGFICLTM